VLPVAVLTLEADCVAHRTLVAEGVPHSEHVLTHDFANAELLATLWAEGGFMLVEHDIAPWCGALEQLSECERDWCMFRYPEAGGLSRGLGCTKFSDRLVRDYPKLPESWRGTTWREMDNVVCAAVAGVLHKENPDLNPLCKHGPPVAHVKEVA